MRREAEALEIFNKFLKDYPGSAVTLDVKFWFAEYYRSKKDFAKALSDHPPHAAQRFSSFIKTIPKDTPDD